MTTVPSHLRVHRLGLHRFLASSLLCVVLQPARAGAPVDALDAVGRAADLACEKESPGIAAYSALRQQAPHLFEPIGDWQQGEITILTQPRQLCEAQEQMRQKYASKGSAAEAWSASRAGVVLEDPYILMLREAVRFPNGKVGLYNRKITRATLDGGVAGVYCLPLLADGRVVMVKEYRHQERRWRLSIPGGFRDDGETAEQAARREATEETGYAVQKLTRLGDVDVEGEAVSLFVAPVEGQAAARSPDEGEALAGTVSVSLSELKRAVINSGYRDTDGTWLSLHANLRKRRLDDRKFHDA